MARTTHRPVVLLSIKPKFASAIMAGEKMVEFRRVRCRTDVKVVLVYATSPVQRLLGYFEVAFVEESTPDNLWRKYGQVGGISHAEYRRYYSGSRTAVAIGVGRLHRLANERPIRHLGRKATPPQGFHYLPLEAIERLNSEPTRVQTRPEPDQ